VLPKRLRVHRRVEFGLVVRRGRRSGRPTLVVHAMAAQPTAQDGTPGGPGLARVGFVVSRAVGGSVVRNRVVRRLRALCATRLDHLPAGTVLVVRALPAAAGATSDRLGSDLDRALRRLGLVGP
jgi:ribonuclease P protein component